MRPYGAVYATSRTHVVKHCVEPVPVATSEPRLAVLVDGRSQVTRLDGGSILRDERRAHLWLGHTWRRAAGAFVFASEVQCRTKDTRVDDHCRCTLNSKGTKGQYITLFSTIAVARIYRKHTATSECMCIIEKAALGRVAVAVRLRGNGSGLVGLPLRTTVSQLDDRAVCCTTALPDYQDALASALRMWYGAEDDPAA